MYAKKSANSRLEYVRTNHKSPSASLLGSASEKNALMETEEQAQPSTAKRSGAKSKPKDSRESSPEEQAPPGCICQRKAKTLVCINCKMFTYGRIAKHCEWHRNVTYLMDFIYCPNCKGPQEALRSVNLDYEVYHDLNAALTSKR